MTVILTSVQIPTPTPTVINTISPNIDLLIQNPYIQYIISPAIVFSVVLFLVYKFMKLGELKQMFKQSITDIGELKSDVKKIKSNMQVVKTHLVTQQGVDANLFASSSPLELKPKGIKLLKESGFKNIYKNNKDWFIEEISKYNPLTLADLDETSFKVLEKCNDIRKFADFKQIAFQHGVSLELLLRVLSIYLRDEVAKTIFKK